MKKIVIAVLMFASCLAFAGAPRAKAKVAPTKAVEVTKAATPVEDLGVGGLGTSSAPIGKGSAALGTRGTGARKLSTAVDTKAPGK